MARNARPRLRPPDPERRFFAASITTSSREKPTAVWPLASALHCAPLLFFIPSGEVWDSGYFDKLSDSHCVTPWRFVYPQGRVPQLDPTGFTTTTDRETVEMFVWDCNHATSPNCKLVFAGKAARSTSSTSTTPRRRSSVALNLPANHDLTVAVTNWANLDAAIESLAFQ